jgi:hypothetical protein
MKKFELRQLIREEIQNVINEEKKYSFTFSYNTSYDDLDYIKRVLNKAKVKAKVKINQPEEMIVKTDNEAELRKAKKAIEDEGLEIDD